MADVHLISERPNADMERLNNFSWMLMVDRLGRQRHFPPARPCRVATAPHPAQCSLSRALQERDATIEQLQAALDTSRRHCALLEAQISSTAGRAAAGASSKDSIREVMAQSQLHATKYKQIRDDYNRLLTKCEGEW